MPSTMERNARALAESSYNGFVRRMVNLPRNILGGFSRVMNQGIDNLMGGRRNHMHHHHHHHQNLHQENRLNFPFQYPPSFPPQQPTLIQEEWAFLSSFEQQYGTTHPFFYACRFADALKMAHDEHKFVFMYIHAPEHPFTPSFCRETLCEEIVVQFLDANFVCWGGLAGGGEGLQMVSALSVSSFPFCAVVAPASCDNLAVLQQREGPLTPAELIEILQKTIEEEGPAFGSGRAKQEDKRRADLQLRKEQVAAYAAALKIDKEKERVVKTASSENRVPKPGKSNKLEPATISGETSHKADKSGGKKAEATQILIRFPNGERRESSFSSKDKIQAIYKYIDSLGIQEVGNYRLISNFPRKVYGDDQMGMTLKDAGLHPKASLFLEVL